MALKSLWAADSSELDFPIGPSPAFIAVLRWWTSQVNLIKGIPLFCLNGRSSPGDVLTIWWGVHALDQMPSGLWSKEEQQEHFGVGNVNLSSRPSGPLGHYAASRSV